MVRMGSLALDGSFPRDGVSIKTLVVVTIHHHKPLMSENALNNSLNNSVNEARTDNCEGLLLGKCPVGKQRGPGRYQITARKKWTKEENKTAISCYLKATKESKPGYRKRMHNLWNEIEMFEIKEQHIACQVCSIFKNNRLTEIEIQQLWREIEKD